MLCTILKPIWKWKQTNSFYTQIKKTFEINVNTVYSFVNKSYKVIENDYFKPKPCAKILRGSKFPGVGWP